MDAVEIAKWSDVPDHMPIGATVEGIDLVIVRRGDDALRPLRPLPAPGRAARRRHVDGRRPDLRSPRLGLPDRHRRERVQQRRGAREVHERARGRRLSSTATRCCASRCATPSPSTPTCTRATTSDPHMVPEEPFVAYIHELAANGLTKTGHHGPVGAMGVPRDDLPTWDDIQFVTAQLARLPLLDDRARRHRGVHRAECRQAAVARHPDLRVGHELRRARRRRRRPRWRAGAELAGTGICSGEGGMLPEEQAENSRYFYELASARFGWTSTS